MDIIMAGVLVLLLGSATQVNTQTISVEEMNNPNGIIEAPNDPTGDNGYLPDARYLWILDMKTSNVNIDITVENLDLGQPYTDIHDTNTLVNYTQGDFLMIGAGPDILQGNELMFYGSRSAPKKVVVRSGVAHVFFYSTKSITTARGFNISYNVTGMQSTEAPPTTPPPPGPILPSAVISINGINESKWLLHNDSFQNAISAMATDYMNDVLNITNSVNSSEVIINQARSCHPSFCQIGMCVAYNFSVTTLRQETQQEEVVFDKASLDGMLGSPSANKYIQEAFGENCQICNDNPNINLFFYVGITLAVIIIAFGITCFAWKFTGRSNYSYAQERYERAQREKMEDQRRRSSGDISILGIGIGSIASRGSENSRRFTMPFPKSGGDEVDNGGEENYEEVDTSGFIQYEPDQVMTDAARFGLGGVTELTGRDKGSQQYVNKAFVGDEDGGATLQKPSPYSVDSDTDSEEEGAISFRPKRTEMTTRKTRFEVPAEIHSADVEGETEF